MEKRAFLHACSAAALATLAPASGTAQTPAGSSTPGPLHTLTGTNSEGKPVMLTDYAGKVCLVSFFTLSLIHI